MGTQFGEELDKDGQLATSADGSLAPVNSGPTNQGRPSDTGKGSWFRSITWKKAVLASGAAVVLIGGLSLAEASSAGTRSSTPTAADVSTAGVVPVLEADLIDPGRLETVLARSGISADIRVLHATVIHGFVVAGCEGPNQAGIPQIDNVLGPSATLQKIGNAKGILIKKAAMPRGSVLAFDFWVSPGKTRPSTLPMMSLHQGAPPPCTLPTEIPTALPKPAGTPHQVP